MNADRLREPAGVGIGKPGADGACGQPLHARQADEIGPAQTVVKDAGDLEIGRRFARHAAAVLGPLAGKQSGIGADAQIGAQVSRIGLTGGAPLRPAAAAIGPQAVHSEAKPP